mgnify:CR=1 FL=1
MTDTKKVLSFAVELGDILLRNSAEVYRVEDSVLAIISVYLTTPTLGNLVGAFILTVFSRVLAAKRKNPVTIYLITGIFPLVPGAGIYYTSYY